MYLILLFHIAALQKKQSRRSLAEINAFLESSKDELEDTLDPQQLPEPQEPSEHPMMAFINLMLKDLNVQEDPHLSNVASPHSNSTSTASLTPSRSAVSRYHEPACLTKIVAFCSIVPDWSQLQALLRHYLWHVDWKFLVTAQDFLEVQMKDLWLRVVHPAQAYNHRGGSSASASSISLQQGDLSRLALLASVLGETIESMAPDVIAETFPISRPGAVAAGPVKVESDSNPRVKALLLLTYHVPALIEECVRLDEMTIELVQANLSAFSLWSNQGLHGTGTNEFPRWNVTIRAAKGCNLFEDPGNNSNFSQVESDHRRRLAWLVYGYDHAFAVGANTKPLIVESQFCVDQPSEAAPWSACGAPPDPCLAMLEVEGGKIAQLVSSTLCYGPPLHRKAMETDSKILASMSKLDASYMWDNPDLSYDSRDPFRARRRCWLGLTTAWQRGSLHRQFFFPNGRITNGELATSRHIATDSALRSINAVRELRKMQNRFCDHMGSAWWFQYLTEPSMTLATAALLLIRSKGQGVPGLSNEANCWPTLMHFTKTIDDCIQDLEAATANPSACLPSLLTFAQGCSKLIQQLRGAVQSSFDAFIKSQPDLSNLHNIQIDENIIPLLHPRSRQRSPGSGSQQSGSGHGPAQGSESSGSNSGPTHRHGTKRASASEGSKRPPAASRSRRSIGNRDHDVSARTSNNSSPTRALYAESLSVSPRTSFAVSSTSGPAPTSNAFSAAAAAAGFGQAGLIGAKNAPPPALPQSIAPTATSSQQTSPDSELPTGTLSLSFGPDLGFTPSGGSSVTSQQPPVMAAPHYGVPAMIPEGQLLSPAEPFALRDFYSDDDGQRANNGRGLADWIASVQMSAMLGQQPPPGQ